MKEYYFIFQTTKVRSSGENKYNKIIGRFGDRIGSHDRLPEQFRF